MVKVSVIPEEQVWQDITLLFECWLGVVLTLIACVWDVNVKSRVNSSGLSILGLTADLLLFMSQVQRENVDLLAYILHKVP